MKKSIIILLIFATMFQITACGKTENPQYTSEEYLPESDDQPNIIYRRNFAEGNGGYYFYDPMQYVYYYDLQSKKTHILCNKPECTHEDETCSAYTGGATLRYADGDLYYIAEETSTGETPTGDFYLWRKSGDGSKTEKLFLVLHMEEAEVEFASTLFCIHRGYVYYFLQGMDEKYSSVLYRRKLEKNAREEIIETLESQSQQYDEVYGIGTTLYYVVYDYDKNNSYSELRSYDILSGEKKTELKRMGITEAYYLYGNEMYYTDGQDVCRMDLKSGEDKVIMSKEFSENMFVHADDKYLYFDNSRDIEERLDQLEHIEEKMREWYQERKVYVYDKETLQQVAVLSLSTDVFADFNVAADYLILNIAEEEFEILDKKNIIAENPQWVTIYPSAE